MAGELTLYSRWRNSAGERVRIALNLKGVPYRYVPVSNLAPGEYERLNPQNLLPALDVGGRVIPQSGAILEYLEETYPARPLLPADTVLRARARAFGAHVAAEMHAITVTRVRGFLHDRLNIDDGRVEIWVSHWMSLGFAALEAALDEPSSTRFCFGNEPGWADLHLVPQLAAARRLNFDVAPYARLLAIEAECVGLDAFVRARPESQPDFPG
jgi:maleylacetoacetate isomerase